MATGIAAHDEPIPGYRLIERIGRGGFGEVWKAVAPGGILKAIKFVYGDLQEAMSAGRPADQELKALNRIKAIRHPYILSLERFDIIDGQLMIVMELADRNMFDRLRECQRNGLAGIPRAELLLYFEEVAEALDLMNNEYQIQHLDIKPQNIFLVHNHIKVADFGLAKDLEGKQATLTGGVTPVYAAPETFDGRISRFCDQYSLAIVYQELLTGRRPFDGQNARQLMMQHVLSPPDVSPLPLEEQDIVRHALAKLPGDRFGSCSDFVRALRGAPTSAGAGRGPSTSFVTASSTRDTPTATTPCAAALVGREAENGSGQLPSLAARRTVTRVTENPNAIQAREPVVEIIGPGVLMPTVFVGLGRTGLLVLHSLRRLLHDRFDVPILPHTQFLYIDTEAETLRKLTGITAESPISPSEMVLARLGRPSRYLRDDERFPDLGRWLDHQLLFRMARTPTTEGKRALGRLAFCDYYRKITARFRAKVEAATAPAAMEAANKMTGLGARTNIPRIYVIANLGGGTGSGMFLDVAFTFRHQLKLLGYRQSDVQAILVVPPVEPKVPSRIQTLANTRAALTELLHYGSPQTSYVGRFDPNDGPISDNNRPFQRALFVSGSESTDVATSNVAVEKSAGLIFREMLTNFGRDSDRIRCEATNLVGRSTYYRAFGYCRFHYPRHEILDFAAQQWCLRLVDYWSAENRTDLSSRCATWLGEQPSLTQLSVSALRDCLQKKLGARLPYGPADLQAESTNQTPHHPAHAGEQTTGLNRCAGAGGANDGDAADWARLESTLAESGAELAQEAAARIWALNQSALEVPTLRLAGAEEVARQIANQAKESLLALQSALAALENEVRDLSTRIQTLTVSMDSSKPGTRRSGLGREVSGTMAQLGPKRVELLELQRVADILGRIVQTAAECLDNARQKRGVLESLRANLQAGAPPLAARQHCEAFEAVLPGTARNSSDAAVEFVATLTSDDLAQFDGEFQSTLEREYGSFGRLCDGRVSRTAELADQIRCSATNFLARRLPEWSAAEILQNFAASEKSVAAAAQRGFEKAAPLLATDGRTNGQLCLLGVSADEHGEHITEQFAEALPKARFAPVREAKDILIYREWPVLPEELPHLAKAVDEFIVQCSPKEPLAPNSRFDVAWQLVSRD